MELTNKHQLIGIIFILISTVGWSTAGFFTRSIALDAWTILFWRGIFGGISILIFYYVTEPAKNRVSIFKITRHVWFVTFISALGMTAFINSFTYTSVANVSIIYATVPFFAALLAWMFLAEKPERSMILFSILALIGGIVIVGNGRWGEGLFGDFLALVMTLSLAIMMVMIRKYPKLPMMFAAGLSPIVCAVVISPFAAPFDVTWIDMLWLLAFAIIQTSVGLIFFVYGAKLLAPAKCALISALEAPLAPFWVWLAFSETPDTRTVIGGTIVMVAVIGYLRKDLRREKFPRKDYGKLSGLKRKT